MQKFLFRRFAMRLIILCALLILFFCGCHSERRQFTVDANPSEQQQTDLGQLLASMEAEAGMDEEDVVIVPTEESSDQQYAPSSQSAVMNPARSHPPVHSLSEPRHSAPVVTRSRGSSVVKKTGTGKLAFRNQDVLTDLVPETQKRTSSDAGKQSGKLAFRNQDVSPDLVGERWGSGHSRNLSSVSQRMVTDGVRKVDIVFVMDSSGSMNDLHKIYPSLIDGFLDHLEPLDWQIGFIVANTKVRDQMVPLRLGESTIENTMWISKNTRSYKEVFADTFSQDLKAFRKERPLASLKNFLNSQDSQSLRSDAELAIVILTDNDENHFKHRRKVTAQSVLNTIAERCGENKKIYGYALTVLDDECGERMRANGEGHYAPTVTEFANRTGGGSFSICLPNYGIVSEEIAKDQLGHHT